MWQYIGELVAPAKRLAFRLMALRQRSIRPRVAIICGQELLVVRNWGDRLWSLPGGGLHRGETPEQGAIRECREELGVVIPEAELIFVTTLAQKIYDAPIFMWKSAKKPHITPQKLEITGFQWVKPTKLPPLEQHLREIVLELDFGSHFRYN